VQLHGNGMHTNPFTVLLGARVTGGLHLRGQYRPDELCAEYPARGHEIDRLLAATDRLGVPRAGRGLEWPVLPEDEEELSALPGGGPPDGAYAVLHPGAAAPARRWPLEGFVECGSGLLARGLRVAVSGAAAERPLAAQLTAALGGGAVDLSGRTTLGALAETVRRAAVVVCNDTGVSHLTAAVGVRSVVVFVGSDPDRWAPLDTGRHRAVGRPFPAYDEGHWRPEDRCLGDACAHAPWAGLEIPPGRVAAADVLQAVDELLARASGATAA
jgi:ADP-heptose:LPS heptosyltransferase